jgi:hypothetical protein
VKVRQYLDPQQPQHGCGRRERAAVAGGQTSPSHRALAPHLYRGFPSANHSNPPARGILGAPSDDPSLPRLS